jgi:hypothetical protein
MGCSSAEEVLMKNPEFVTLDTASLMSGRTPQEMRRLCREDKILSRVGPHGVEVSWLDVIELRRGALK